ncbi:threalose-6-phosphate phosphatase [Puccinia graminis f. sp. tritici]|uniref:Threalose-6-phosphate phosphatase n=1 Tax=Puccinia graminis f. sp. tritici TaxID=56615 RepID=A0A5B0Q3V5_PUCGR|nr:threalose-6-phosphate phosphatase [Puccinia graminis f. sp. tritici]
MYDRAQVHYGLAQERPDEDDWEPPQLDGLPELHNIRHRISLIEEEIRSKGKLKLTGHVIMACHALPYLCNLHLDPTTTTDTTNTNTIPEQQQQQQQQQQQASVKPDQQLPPSPTTPLTASHNSTFRQSLEIRPGDLLTHPQSLHSPTCTPIPSSGILSASKTSSLLDTSIPAPTSVTNPTLNPVSSVASHRNNNNNITHNHNHSDNLQSSTVTADEEQEEPAFKWILEPRRGHAALNAGIKSLSNYRSITLCAYPADIRIANHSNELPEPIEASKLSELQKLSLDSGLRHLARSASPDQSPLNDHHQLPIDPNGPKRGIECVPVWVGDRSAGLHYEGFCKKYLWPIFHYMPLSEHQDKKEENLAWKAYEEVNYAFAKRIASVYQPGDLIWIQDYHLLLVPRMLRKMLPKCHVGLFLHSPFPSSEFFRCLPRREEILDGMLGADLLCFQTYSYGRHFISACIRVMGLESVGNGIECNGMITDITYCPIGIDADRIELEKQLPGVRPKMDALRKLYEGKKIIIGRDKLDPTKGVLHKLKAFEYLLKSYPQWRNRVVLIQVTSPSPTDSPQLATKISELVDHINATYGTLHFQPVHHYHQTIERDEYFALLSVADLAVITSIRDGMNTTSMEYTICQEENKNPLILSEFTGVTGSMKSAVKVNPWDLGDVARAIDQCLNMSEAEKVTRHAQLYSRVKSHSSSVWASTLLLQLLQCLRSDQTKESVKLLDEEDMVKKYKQANKRLLLFDYDGTLTPIVKNPKDAIPPPGLIDALERLCADERNIVYIISGRDGSFLQKHLGSIAGLGMSAEHGCFLREPGAKEWIDLTENIDMSWMDDVEEIFKYYEARTLGAFVEKKISSVTWHYRNADPQFGLFQAKECQALLESLQERMPIDILKGKKNIECRPAHTNKGEIVKRLLYTSPDVGFALCVGDDKTDEDMFRALKMLRSNACLDGHVMGHVHSTTIDPPQTLSLYPILARSSSIGPGQRISQDGSAAAAAAAGGGGGAGNNTKRPIRRRYSSNTSMHATYSCQNSPISAPSVPQFGLPSVISTASSSPATGGAIGSTSMSSQAMKASSTVGSSSLHHMLPSPKLEPVESVLEPESIFSLVIDENESRKTLAEYRLDRPLQLVAVLARLSQLSPPPSANSPSSH